RAQRLYFGRTLDGVSFATRYQYDDAGRLVTTTFPDGQTLTNQHDGMSRVVGIEGVLDAVTYDGRGLLSGIDYKNGVKSAWTYDPRERPTTIKVTSKSSKGLYGVSFQRDKIGNITAIDDNADARVGRPSAKATYKYDAWYRVTEASL